MDMLGNQEEMEHLFYSLGTEDDLEQAAYHSYHGYSAFSLALQPIYFCIYEGLEVFYLDGEDAKLYPFHFLLMLAICNSEQAWGLTTRIYCPSSHHPIYFKMENSTALTGNCCSLRCICAGTHGTTQVHRPATGRFYC